MINNENEIDRDCVICMGAVFDETISDRGINKTFAKAKSGGRWYEGIIPAKLFNILSKAPYQHTCNKLYHLYCITTWRNGESENNEICPNCNGPLAHVFTYKEIYDEIIEKIRSAVLVVFSLTAGLVGNKLFSGNALGVAIAMLGGYYLTNREIKTALVQASLYPAEVTLQSIFCWSLGITEIEPLAD
jgi:hypothetical protein